MKVSAAISLHASGTPSLGCCIPFRLPCHPIASSQQHQSCCISSRGYSESNTEHFSNIPWNACVALKTWGGFERHPCRPRFVGAASPPLSCSGKSSGPARGRAIRRRPPILLAPCPGAEPPKFHLPPGRAVPPVVRGLNPAYQIYSSRTLLLAVAAYTSV